MLQHRRCLTGHLHLPLKFSCLSVKPTAELPFVSWRNSLHVKQCSSKCLPCLTLVPVWQVSNSDLCEVMSNTLSAENVISKINLCSKRLTQCVTKITYRPTIWYKHGGCVGKSQHFRVALYRLTFLTTCFLTRRSQSLV
jgi:hypothetical protein